MPAPQDALFIASVHYLPNLTNLFFDRHVAFKQILENGQVDRRQTGGEYAAFDVIVDGPGNYSKQTTGGEAFSYGRRNILRQGRVFIPTGIYAFGVEGKVLRHGSGPTSIDNLLKRYPEAGVLDMKQRTIGQVLTGNGAAAGYDGFTTFNGDTTYNPDGAALNGLFDFATVAAQITAAEVVENISAATTGWQGQYGNITSFGLNGKRIYRDVYNQCTMRSVYEQPPTIGLADSTSVNNYYETQDNQVWIQNKASGEQGKSGTGVDDGIPFQSLMLYPDPSIDDNLAQFGHTVNGTTYFISPDSFIILWIGGESGDSDVDLTKGFFEMRGPYKLEGRDAWGYEIVNSWQLGCTNRKANAAIEGSAIL